MNYTSFLNWLIMRSKLWPEHAAEAQQQHDAKCRLKSSHVKSVYFNHPSQGTWTNYYTILGPRDKTAPPTSQQIGQFPPKRVKYRHPRSFFFFFILHPQESSLCSQPFRGKVRRTGRIFQKLADEAFWTPNIAALVCRKNRTRFTKKKFAH